MTAITVPTSADASPPERTRNCESRLLIKDRIKETLHDAFGASEPDRAWSRRLG
jgi:hypothetical protein